MMKRLFISFSGGRTSAYMAHRLLKAKQYEEFIVAFANTGGEDERTLKFVDRCDREFNFNVVWVEAVVTAELGIGTKHRVVTYATASRAGEPFEDAIRKFGIPNKNFPNCTRELKQRPLEAYARSMGWRANSYHTAIGIRADEADRMSVLAEDNCIVYPLIKWGIRKSDVLTWWGNQSFDLELPEYRGNCVTCWKKSDRKLMTIAAEDPRAFDFFDRMEKTYPDAGPGDFDRPRRFFRHNRSAQDIIEASHKPFVPWRAEAIQTEMFDPMDIGGGCGESCEVFSD